MGHGTPVDPGSAADQCGTAGTYFLDTICSAYHDARLFGLNGGGSRPRRRRPPTTPPPTTPPAARRRASRRATTRTSRPAGRTSQLGYVYANGPTRRMGLYNVFHTNALRQTGPNFWVVGC